MDPSHPVLLLLAARAERVDEMLTHFIEADGTVHTYHKSSLVGPNWHVRFKGVGFSIKIAENQLCVADFKRVFFGASLDEIPATVAIGLDHNVSGGEKIAPVAACLLEFAALLAGETGAFAVAWTPASIVSDSGYFKTAVNDYARGGAFPSLSVIDFIFSDDGQNLKTQGLGWFAGQELELKGQGLTQTEIMRRAVRIVHDIATNGPIETAGHVPDLDPEHVLSLCPNTVSSVVIGTIRSNMDTVSL